jgi:glycine dehydrogenase
MSFPVPGTLMIEPTESEDLREIERFCDAMIAIRAEIDSQPALLQNAPHTAAMLLRDPWEQPYTREEAAYPVPDARESKYWPPVRRIDGGYGDRNLMCSCPPVSAYE